MDIDAADAASTNSTTCHERLHFPDGDIILHAESGSNGAVRYRLHKVILSHNSPVFRDAFSVPSSPEINELQDGIPVVRMPDDATQLSELLCACYYPDSLVFKRSDSGLHTRMRGLLLLAEKYQISWIHTQIVRHLEAEWPCTLEQWYRFDGDFKKKCKFVELTLDGEWGDVAAEMDFPEPASAIRLGTEFGIKSILSAAYYKLAISDVKMGHGEPQTYEQRTANWDLLDREDWMRLMKGRDRLIEEATSVSTLLAVGGGGPICTRHSRCSLAMEHLFNSFNLRCSLRWSRMPDVIHAVYEVLERWEQWGLCDDCRIRLEYNLRLVVTRVWDNLPRSFCFDILK